MTEDKYEEYMTLADQARKNARLYKHTRGGWLSLAASYDVLASGEKIKQRSRLTIRDSRRNTDPMEGL